MGTERKSGDLADNAASIVRRAIYFAHSEDLMDVFTCIGDTQSCGRPIQVSKGSDLTSNMQRSNT